MIHPEAWRFNTSHPALLWLDSDTFQVAQWLRYQARSGDVLEIPLLHRGALRLGFLTDGGSKPLWSNAIVGDRCDELMLAYVHHDGLFVFKSVLRGGQRLYVDFAYTQHLLDEMMEICGATRTKRNVILAAVAAGGSARYAARVPCNVDTIRPDALTEDWAVLCGKFTPSFDPMEEVA